jgi:hypothetical protein
MRWWKQWRLRDGDDELAFAKCVVHNCSQIAWCLRCNIADMQWDRNIAFSVVKMRIFYALQENAALRHKRSNGSKHAIVDCALRTSAADSLQPSFMTRSELLGFGIRTWSLF